FDRGDGCAAIDDLASGHVIALVDDRLVLPWPAVDDVRDVVTGKQAIVTGAAEQVIGATAAGEIVVAAAAIKRVACGAPGEHVGAHAAVDIFDIGPHVVGLADLAVVGAVIQRHAHTDGARDVARDVATTAADELVAAGTTDQLVVPGAAV